ncbi:MAG: ATP-grasp domain-containing protein [Nitrospiraceae bacterium]|nr:ATP-grasp domain-containing protein [Nitrospiraceae bacterium]
MGDMITAMVTGGGAPGTAGTIFALRNNPDNAGLRIVTTDIRDHVVGKYLSDAFYTVPQPEDDDYVGRLSDIVRRENIKVIIPQTTREVETISEYEGHFRGLGARVIASEYKSVKEANDKSALLARAEKTGIPFPLYVLTRSEDEFVTAVKGLGYPAKKVVIKPPVSNGMRGLRILSGEPWNVRRFLGEKPDGTEIDLDNILKILRNGIWPPLLVSKYMEGAEYTVDVFRNGSGVVAIPRLRKSIRSGITFESHADYREDMMEYSRKLADACDLKYCFGFQFKLSREGIPKLLECNPRVQGTMVFSAFAGFNMIYYSVQEALGRAVDTGNVTLSRNIHFKRYWGGIASGDGVFIGRV